MDNTTKIVIGVGVVAAIGVVWYFSTQPAQPKPVVAYKVVPPALTVNPVAQDITAAAGAAGTISDVINNLSSTDTTSTDESNLSGIGYGF